VEVAGGTSGRVDRHARSSQSRRVPVDAACCTGGACGWRWPRWTPAPGAKLPAGGDVAARPPVPVRGAIGADPRRGSRPGPPRRMGAARRELRRGVEMRSRQDEDHTRRAEGEHPVHPVWRASSAALWTGRRSGPHPATRVTPLNLDGPGAVELVEHQVEHGGGGPPWPRRAAGSRCLLMSGLDPDDVSGGDRPPDPVSISWRRRRPTAGLQSRLFMAPRFSNGRASGKTENRSLAPNEPPSTPPPWPAARSKEVAAAAPVETRPEGVCPQNDRSRLRKFGMHSTGSTQRWSGRGSGCQRVPSNGPAESPAPRRKHSRSGTLSTGPRGRVEDEGVSGRLSVRAVGRVAASGDLCPACPDRVTMRAISGRPATCRLRSSTRAGRRRTVSDTGTPVFFPSHGDGVAGS